MDDDRKRPHQREAERKVIETFQAHDRAKLLMACGTGKTLTALFIDETMKNELTVFAVPSLALLSQALHSWRQYTITPFNALAVCSDRTVTRRETHNFQHEEGMAVTNDIHEVIDFLRLRRKRVIFITYHSMSLLQRAQQAARMTIDLLICDEAHRTVGPEDKEFTRVLRPNELQAHKRLFMTATPRFLLNQPDAYSMDDVTDYGPTAYELPFSQAIEDGLLTDYQLVIMAIPRDEVGRVHPRVTGHVDEVAPHIGVSHAIATYQLRSGITYHSTIRKSLRFAACFPLVNAALGRSAVAVTTVTGAMSSQMRRERLATLARRDPPPALVTNCRVLNEGVDVPSLDFIGIIDPKASVTELIQIVGRVLRQAEGKGIGTVVIPVISEEETDAGFQLAHSSYRTVYNVVRALRAHDRIFGQAIDHLRAGTGTSRLRRADLVDNFDRKVRFEGCGLNPRVLRDFAQSLRMRIVEHTYDGFEVFTEQLAAWIERSGREPTPNEDSRLANFCGRQRVMRKKGKLTQARIEALDAIGFRWNTENDTFPERLKALDEFRRRYGRYPMQTENQVGRWVSIVRQRYKEGKLERNRVEALNAIQFVWDEREQAWRDKVHAITKFRTQHGRLPNQSVQSNRQERMLANWALNQVTYYRAGNLSEDKARALRSLGLDLDKTLKSSREAWYEQFNQVKEYMIKNGVTPPESAGVLATWVTRQRQQHKKGRLEAEYVAALNRIGFAWSGEENKDIVWSQWLGRLKSHMDKHGHDVEHYPTQGPLYAWVLRQRLAYSRGKLSQKRIEALNAIGFHWKGRQRKGKAA